MVFLFKAALVRVPELDQYRGYEMVALKNGELENKVKFSDARRQLNSLFYLYPGITREGAEVLVKYTLDGKEYSYGRITEVKGTSDLAATFAVGIEKLDASGNPTGKITYLGFQFGGKTGIVLQKIFNADRLEGDDAFFSGLKGLDNCSFSLLGVQKGSKSVEWKDTPSSIYSTKMQTLASKISPGMRGDDLLGKSIEISMNDPKNPAMTITKKVSVMGPCWSDGIAFVMDAGSKEKTVMDFNAADVLVIKTLDK